MNTRSQYQKHVPQSIQALYGLEKSIAEFSLGHTLIDLVKIRVSQMNGCLLCLDMHHKEAKKHGERELRLYHLALWQESELFTEKERAALAWAELLTQPTAHGVSDEAYAKVSEQFPGKELSELTVVIASINAWNRFGIAFKPAAGSMDKVMGLDKVGLS